MELSSPEIKKQIHFFLLAALADLTAFSVCVKLCGISKMISMEIFCLPALDIIIHTLRLSLHIDDDLILLFNQHAHLLEHLRKLCKRSLDFLNFGVSLLHLPVGPSRRAVSVGIEQLHKLALHADTQNNVPPERRPADYRSRSLA